MNHPSAMWAFSRLGTRPNPPSNRSDQASSSRETGEDGKHCGHMKAEQPVIRISKGTFAPDRLEQVGKPIDEPAIPLVPEILRLHGLLYYPVAVDSVTCTVVNVSVLGRCRGREAADEHAVGGANLVDVRVRWQLLPFANIFGEFVDPRSIQASRY